VTAEPSPSTTAPGAPAALLTLPTHYYNNGETQQLKWHGIYALYYSGIVLPGGQRLPALHLLKPHRGLLALMRPRRQVLGLQVQPHC